VDYSSSFKGHFTRSSVETHLIGKKDMDESFIFKIIVYNGMHTFLAIILKMVDAESI
jgi:hypothetical protein